MSLLRVRLMRDRGNLLGARQLVSRHTPESSWLAGVLTQEATALHGAGSLAATDAPEPAADGTMAGRHDRATGAPDR